MSGEGERTEREEARSLTRVEEQVEWKRGSDSGEMEYTLLSCGFIISSVLPSEQNQGGAPGRFER